jgi:ATP-dependent RNA helicase DeaD
VGRSGQAISFVSGRELFQIRNIERYANARIHRARIPTEAEVEEARENVFTDKLRATLKSGEFKRQDQLIERLLEEGFTSTDIASACLAQLQSGEAAPAHPPRTAEYERPERPDDRRAPRYENRERFERPQRFAERRDVRPPRVAAPAAKLPRPEKPPATGAPVSVAPALVKVVPATSPVESEGRARHSVRAVVHTPASSAHGVTRPTTDAAVKPEVEKTFSDEEILASVKPEPRKPVESKPPRKSAPPWERREHSEEKAVRPPKPSRPPAGDFTRLHMNLGEKMGVVPIDIVNAIAGETGLPGKVVGNVDIRERHLFVDVATDHANAILAKLNRTRIKGHKVKVKAA